MDVLLAPYLVKYSVATLSKLINSHLLRLLHPPNQIPMSKISQSYTFNIKVINIWKLSWQEAASTCKIWKIRSKLYYWIYLLSPFSMYSYAGDIVKESHINIIYVSNNRLPGNGIQKKTNQAAWKRKIGKVSANLSRSSFFCYQMLRLLLLLLFCLLVCFNGSRTFLYPIYYINLKLKSVINFFFGLSFKDFKFQFKTASMIENIYCTQKWKRFFGRQQLRRQSCWHEIDLATIQNLNHILCGSCCGMKAKQRRQNHESSSWKPVYIFKLILGFKTNAKLSMETRPDETSATFKYLWMHNVIKTIPSSS